MMPKRMFLLKLLKVVMMKLFNISAQFLKTCARRLKYDFGYNFTSFTPYLVPLDQCIMQIPNDVFVLTGLDYKNDLVTIKHLRNGDTSNFPFKVFNDLKMVDIGRTQDAHSNGWFRIQLMEKIINDGAKITVQKKGWYRPRGGKYDGMDCETPALTIMSVEKGNQNANFLNDFIDAIDEDGDPVSVYFYDVISFK